MFRIWYFANELGLTIGDFGMILCMYVGAVCSVLRLYSVFCLRMLEVFGFIDLL